MQQTVNPCLAEMGKEYNIEMQKSVVGTISSYFKAVGDSPDGKIFVAKEAMNKAYAEWGEKNKKK